MLKKYNHFLFESLVLESVVFYSDKFRKLLKDIDSPVSSAILDLETKDIDTANSMLDNLLRGTGVQGVILSTAKNVIIDLFFHILNNS